jgi:hypothetical protein
MSDGKELAIQQQSSGPIGPLPTDDASSLPPSLRILLDDGFYNRVKQLAGVMSKAVGFTPRHLLDKPEACFAVITMALDWRLSPNFVGRHTYQTPGGSIGFDGALVQSALEQSQKFVGAPMFEYHGDWTSLLGKFVVTKSEKGADYVKPTWTQKDAVGLGVIVRWYVRGEKVARVWPGEKEPFWLTQCFPLNSPLWATDPKTQIAYLAIRRFANLTSPGILGAAAFDQDELIDASEMARNVTPPPPRPTREVISKAPPPKSQVTYELINCDGEPIVCTLETVEAEVLSIFAEARRRGRQAIEAAIENNMSVVYELALTEAMCEIDDLRVALKQAEAEQNPAHPEPVRPPASVSPHVGEAETPPASPSPGGADHSATVQSDGQSGEKMVGQADVLPAAPTGATPRNCTVEMVYDRNGQPARRAWFNGAFLSRIRTSTTSDEFAGWIAANGEAIQAYYKENPAGEIAAKKELEEIQKRLEGGVVGTLR